VGTLLDLGSGLAQVVHDGIHLRLVGLELIAAGWNEAIQYAAIAAQTL
jgi:hypothetical protein